MLTKKEQPYPPSWADRFPDWINSLPVPVWLSIAMIYLITVAFYHIAFWLDGQFPPGSLDGILFFNGIWSVIGISFIMTLDRVAHRAIDKFSALVPRKKKELELLRYEMTTIPARAALLLSLLIIAVIGAGAAFEPLFLGVSHPVAVAIFLLGFCFSYAFAPIMLFHGFRQLTLVGKAYRMVDEINLFHLQPLYAFSGLSLTSSLFWLLILNMDFVSNFTDGELLTSDILFSMVLTIPYIFLAFATFIVPLWGIHRRIQNKKEASIEENGLQIEKAHLTLYRHLNKDDYKKTAEMEKSLASLYKMREQIEKVPTWPWNAGTLRGFLSAVFLPIGIWLTQQILSRFL